MTPSQRPQIRIGNGYLLPITFAALCAMTGAFLLTGSSIDPESKTIGFYAIMGAFLVVCVALYVTRNISPQHDAGGGEELEALARLDGAGEFLAGSVKLPDMFRVVASRVREVVPARVVALYLIDDGRERLQLAEMDGAESMFGHGTFNADTCVVKRAVHVADNGVVAIPLLNAGEPFGALELYFDDDRRPVGKDLIFDAVGTRVAPLILNSLSFERTVTNALTDAITDLPNERALFLILENQIAESQRKREERPLTLLAIDIRGFDEVNQKFGHAAGDRALAFVAEAIRDNLRQMDFLARCSDDEFLAVLPTASKEISHEVIARVTTALFGRRLKITDEDLIEAELNFGSATFGEDGDTADQLIATARLRKQQTKTPEPAKVLWFSPEAAA